MGGERTQGGGLGIFGDGSSPRGRGTPYATIGALSPCRIIPAWAGNAAKNRIETRVSADHPRVGGERVLLDTGKVLGSGSSPRGRGTLLALEDGYYRRRIIPAWAGNAHGAGSQSRAGPDHPRVGGERDIVTMRPPCPVGSSPRGRGTRTIRTPAEVRCRIIPAWAGNALPGPLSRIACSDHPRVGGERPTATPGLGGRGGSSPRGRGTLGDAPRHHADGRIIPAWAGNANRLSGTMGPVADHPRVGGERAF